MQLKVLLGAKPLHRGVAPRLGQGDLHGLAEQIEAVDFLCCLLRRLRGVEDDKCLAFRLQVGLGHNVDDIAKLGEELAESILQRVDLDALLEVPHVDAVTKKRLVTPVLTQCRSAMTHT